MSVPCRVFLIYFLTKAYVASLTAILTVRNLTPAVAGWQDIQSQRLTFGMVRVDVRCMTYELR
jgi:hypothetical protein